MYRIKSVLTSTTPISTPDTTPEIADSGRYIVNWAFGRWTCTPLISEEEHESSAGKGVILRMTMILARFESKKWKKKIESGNFVSVEGAGGVLVVEKIE